MKSLVYALIVVAILAAILTNPDENRHKEILKNKFTLALQKSFNKGSDQAKDDNADVGQALGSMLGGFVTGAMIDNFVSADNYVLFSTTKIMWEGETRTIGIGAFGNVFLLKELDKALENPEESL